MLHHELQPRLEWLREIVLRLHGKLQEIGEPFELPAPTEEQIAFSREPFDWKAIRGTPKENHAREWMHDKQREELEAWERAQAEMLRGGE